MCGSFCTFDAVFDALERIADEYEVVPIMSANAYGTDTRFGSASDYRARLEAICGRAAISTIAAAEPIGPKKLLDLLVIAPATGNTLAKLAHGVSDTSVTLAYKAHLRNRRPVLIAPSTNDALSMNAPNIGALLNRAGHYFVPFGQDDAEGKPTSLQSDFSRIPQAIAAALDGRQLQPLLISYSSIEGAG
jgi:dipicolinate synthase subunit B